MDVGTPSYIDHRLRSSGCVKFYNGEIMLDARMNPSTGLIRLSCNSDDTFWANIQLTKEAAEQFLELQKSSECAERKAQIQRLKDSKLWKSI